jgi:hypothetical protein
MTGEHAHKITGKVNASIERRVDLTGSLRRRD